jgi:molybdopterin adenylyltransferase
MIRVGILGLARREGTFSEVGLRSWEEAGCAAVEEALMTGNEAVYTVHRPLVVRVARPAIEQILRDWCDVPNAETRCHLILTVGGTGYSEGDVLPEATQALLTRDAPGIAELLRRTAAEACHLEESISRGVAGTRGGTLLINLPGDAKGMAHPGPLTSSVQALLPLLPKLIASLQPG